jgi:hypothetical protein
MEIVWEGDRVINRKLKLLAPKELFRLDHNIFLVTDECDPEDLEKRLCVHLESGELHRIGGETIVRLVWGRLGVHFQGADA